MAKFQGEASRCRSGGIRGSVAQHREVKDVLRDPCSSHCVSRGFPGEVNLLQSILSVLYDKGLSTVAASHYSQGPPCLLPKALQGIQDMLNECHILYLIFGISTEEDRVKKMPRKDLDVIQLIGV